MISSNVTLLVSSGLSGTTAARHREPATGNGQPSGGKGSLSRRGAAARRLTKNHSDVYRQLARPTTPFQSPPGGTLPKALGRRSLLICKEPIGSRHWRLNRVGKEWLPQKAQVTE
jgi:hypothetical protein